jgi:hypothetical protein
MFDEFGLSAGRKDGLRIRAGADAPVAPAVDHASVGLDFNFDHAGVFEAGQCLQVQSALGALGRCQVTGFVALGQAGLVGASVPALASLLSSGLAGLAVFALRLIASFAAFAFTPEYALTKFAYLGECHFELGLQVGPLLCALLKLLLLALAGLVQRLFELVAQLRFVLGKSIKQLCFLQLQPLLSNHCALVGCLPIVGVHDKLDVFALCQRHPNLIKGPVTMGFSDGCLGELCAMHVGDSKAKRGLCPVFSVRPSIKPVRGDRILTHKLK